LQQYLLRSKEILSAAEQDKCHDTFLYLDDEMRIMTEHVEEVYRSMIEMHKKLRRLYAKKPPQIKPCDVLEPKRLIVRTLDEVEETPLFYVTSLNQYAINIGGTIVRGNLLSVKTKQEFHRAESSPQVSFLSCESGNGCKALHNSANGGPMCNYWHDPLALQKLRQEGKLSTRMYARYINRTPVALNTSWLYWKGPRSTFVKWMGSKDLQERDKLLGTIGDLQFKKNMAEYQRLLMHDLLVCLTFAS